MELQALRAQDNFVCRRCSNFGRSSTPRIIAPSQLKDSGVPSSSSRPVFLEFHKPSSSLRVVNASQPTLSGCATTQPFQKTSRSSDTIVAHPKIVNIRSPFSPLSASTVYSESGSGRRRSITFNKEVERVLDVEIAHALSHGKPISCVNFSQDGEHIAAGCVDGKVYVYDVKSGNLTR